jgi:MFS family permease
MTLSQADPTPLSASEHQVQLRRAVIASTVGTAIEWYDFFLYSTVTGLVFAKLFFPHSDPWVGTLEAFAIYAVGFVARPVGAAYGDRIGRKRGLARLSARVGDRGRACAADRDMAVWDL